MPKVELDDYQQHLLDAMHEASRDYDQAVLTLGAGSLALSITFSHDITPNPLPGTEAILLLSWMALVASLISTFISFRLSRLVLAKTWRNYGTANPVPSVWGWITETLNVVSGVALIGGLALFGYYALQNM